MMNIAVPREIKNREYRVALLPAQVKALVAKGHSVMVETQAGQAIGFSDEAYLAAGAKIETDVDALFRQAELIVKVKEPQPVECARLQPHQTLFTYLHLASDEPQTQALIASQATCIAYETVQVNQSLPLLAPMSEIAGRLSVQAGAHCLEKRQGGKGVLLAGVPGVAPANVIIIGAGVVGQNALQMAMGLGADVTILDRDINKLRHLDALYGNRVKTRFSDEATLESLLPEADLVIGAVLIPGDRAPRLIRKEQLKLMAPGSVLVDVAIDQGGCFETSKATTHDEPTYEVEGIVHYCVANMPGAVAKTSAQALTNATFPFVAQLADLGAEQALTQSSALALGCNVYQGQVTCEAVAKAQGLEYVPLASLLPPLTKG